MPTALQHGSAHLGIYRSNFPATPALEDAGDYFIGPQIGAAHDAPDPSPALRLNGILFSFGLADLPRFDVDRYHQDPTYSPGTELVTWIQNDPRFEWEGGPPEFANYFPVAGNPMPGGFMPPISEPPTVIGETEIFDVVIWVVGLGLVVALFCVLRPAKISKLSRMSPRAPS